MVRRYRRALITGASSGIGAAFAAELPDRTDLLLAGRDTMRLEAQRLDLTRGSRRVETVAGDLTRDQDLDALIEAAEAFEIDLLINNAGSGQLGRFLDTAPEAERSTLLLNVVATTMLTRALLPGMIERARQTGTRAGVIIVSSQFAFAPVPFLATYAASKVYGLHFAEALADEVRGDPVDVMALCPGPTRSAFSARAGFSLASLPGLSDPRTVAREALRAIGRERTHISGTINQATLAPFVVPRRWITGAIGTAMRFVAGQGR